MKCVKISSKLHISTSKHHLSLPLHSITRISLWEHNKYVKRDKFVFSFIYDVLLELLLR